MWWSRVIDCEPDIKLRSEMTGLTAAVSRMLLFGSRARRGESSTREKDYSNNPNWNCDLCHLTSLFTMEVGVCFCICHLLRVKRLTQIAFFICSRGIWMNTYVVFHPRTKGYIKSWAVGIYDVRKVDFLLPIFCADSIFCEQSLRCK